MRLHKATMPKAAVLTLVLLVTQLVSAPPAQALTFVSCSNGSGEFTLDPPIRVIPTNVGVATAAPIEYQSCAGSGITDATTDFVGTIVLSTCLPLIGPIDLYGAAEAAGTMVMTWTGGTGAATTTFNWTIVGTLQIGPDTSVIELVGNSVAGRYHIPLAPAVLAATSTVTNLRPRCPGTTNFTGTNISFQVFDLA